MLNLMLLLCCSSYLRQWRYHQYPHDITLIPIVCVCVLHRIQGTGGTINIILYITTWLCFPSCLRHCLAPSMPVESHVFYYMIMFIIAFEALQGPWRLLEHYTYNDVIVFSIVFEALAAPLVSWVAQPRCLQNYPDLCKWFCTLSKPRFLCFAGPKALRWERGAPLETSSRVQIHCVYCVQLISQVRRCFRGLRWVQIESFHCDFRAFHRSGGVEDAPSRLLSYHFYRVFHWCSQIWIRQRCLQKCKWIVSVKFPYVSTAKGTRYDLYPEVPWRRPEHCKSDDIMRFPS